MRAVALLVALVAAPAEAGCRMALLLALDVSSSVDDAEDRVQRAGLARALMAPEVQAAMFSSPETVALAAFEWSGRYQQEVILPWTPIADPGDLARAAAVIAGSERRHEMFPTALGYALGYAAGLFRDAPDCRQMTLDVSGDGENNEGFPPALAYAHFPLGGVTVNGLAIGAEAGVGAYYRREVIRGPGAFVERAADFADYERAMRRKLRRELEAVFGTAAGGDPAARGG